MEDKKMDQKIVISIILGVLVIISAVQAFQLYTLKEKVSTSGLKTGGSSVPIVAGSAGSAGGAGVPSSAGGLPQMVGGC